ncbi:MAG: hypothetical protein SRB2_04321 [Desulfobacteraceae bacterium Eth-SRB2]|nr:MAG: hypothetical protein SRB2_04321 [Desulfobacteraceae bacterium Eth-SRB2]
MDAIIYMETNKLPKQAIKPIIANMGMICANDSQWLDFLADNGIVKDRHVQIATEGALIGSIIEHGISKELVIISDDAGQFNILLRALCWIHANRAIDKIIPFTDQAKKDLIQCFEPRIIFFYPTLYRNPLKCFKQITKKEW